MYYLADDYPVALWRGEEVNIEATLADHLLVVTRVSDTKRRMLHVDKKYLVTKAPQTAVSRMTALEELQAYESVLFSVWDGSADPTEVTEVMERLVTLMTGGSG